MLIIPFAKLAPDTLQALIEEFVTRDGTDYGAVELSMQEKTNQVMMLLHQKHIFLCFDEETQHCTILPKEQLQDLLVDE